MKIRRTKHVMNRKTLAIIVIAVLLLGALCLGFVQLNHNRSNIQQISTKADSSPYFKPEQMPVPTAGDEAYTSDPTPDSVASPESPTTTTSGDVITTSPPSLKVRIDEAFIKGDVLSVKAVSTQQDNAECLFEIIKNAERVTAKATKLISYACENPKLDISVFRPGDITISVKIVSGNDVASAVRTVAL